MTTSKTSFEKLLKYTRETALISSVEELIGWDERTIMPPKAGTYRADQITLLAGMVHGRRSDPAVGELLGEVESDTAWKADFSEVDGAAIVKGIRRDFDRATKVPAAIVEDLTRLSVLGQQSWVEARKANDFQSFQPILEKIVRLKREEAEAVGYHGSPYDALLDEYEPGETTANVKKILGDFRDELVKLTAAIFGSGKTLPLEIIERKYPIEAQKSFSRMAATKIGFDFESGRIDETHHPFCATMGPNDCRITTRYNENHFNGAFFGTLHESGHGIYEQGLRSEFYGLAPGSYCSLGIHESQSRLWENNVGRSRAFWKYFYPQAKSTFPEALSNVELEEFYAAINDVRPSLIRVEADEVTYNLHIIIRFELEQELICGEIEVADLPDAWHAKYEEYLGIKAPNDADGVLQDVHWSAALFGYFPTYSLGNLYAAQFFAKADEELGGLEAQFEVGNFDPLRGWLQTNVYDHGFCYSANELVEKATGEKLSHQPLITYLKEKFEPLYGIG